MTMRSRRSVSLIGRWEDFWISRFGPFRGGLLAGCAICTVVIAVALIASAAS